MHAGSTSVLLLTLCGGFLDWGVFLFDEGGVGASTSRSLSFAYLSKAVVPVLACGSLELLLQLRR
jgi:hypothetical protein